MDSTVSREIQGQKLGLVIVYWGKLWKLLQKEKLFITSETKNKRKYLICL